MTSSQIPNIPVVESKAVDEAVARIRELNEKIIDAAKAAGNTSLDTYEDALRNLVEFEQNAAKRSQLDWVAAIAETHAKFVQSVSESYVAAAREVLK
ncbi:hypothetical protein FK529_01810 [Tsukamurella asaccharolytica]|uniref:Uncharacterized protein n=1 Tax=Tsukamurella asaccharolytica TaxID=2592067 RepID=A0A5C5RG26_9ACTN|nr:hypothetical protein [Tsukamurella asaccharolytica]TWS21363.1 hypothetical protein FK529_01810 [Tsukamurella asaccharolytica]